MISLQVLWKAKFFQSLSEQTFISIVLKSIPLSIIHIITSHPEQLASVSQGQTTTHTPIHAHQQYRVCVLIINRNL